MPKQADVGIPRAYLGFGPIFIFSGGIRRKKKKVSLNGRVGVTALAQGEEPQSSFLSVKLPGH